MKSDQKLQQDVMQELDWEPAVTAAHIGVAVEDGVVTLSGFVPSYAEKREAEQATLRVEGVRAAADEIEVQLPGSSHRTDTDLARAAANVIEWNAYLPDQGLDVKVDHGFVTISGEVAWQNQKQQAVNAVRALTGVRGVADLVTIKPTVKAYDLKAKIERAFERTARSDAERVQVSVSGGEVTLAGTVASQAERREATHTAWSAPGVTLVVDRLDVRTPAYV